MTTLGLRGAIACTSAPPRRLQRSWRSTSAPWVLPPCLLSPPVWNPKAMGGTGTNGAPVFRGGRVSWGDSSGQIKRAPHLGVTPGVSYQVGTGDGEVRGLPVARPGATTASTSPATARSRRFETLVPASRLRSGGKSASPRHRWWLAVAGDGLPLRWRRHRAFGPDRRERPEPEITIVLEGRPDRSAHPASIVSPPVRRW